jgi:hypothetical protein
VTGAVRVVYPVTGETVVMGSETALYVATGPLASLVIRLPVVPPVPAELEISFADEIATLIVQDAAGLLLAGGPTSGFGPGAALVFRTVPELGGWTYWK